MRGERAEERLADGLVVARLHAVADVAGGELADAGANVSNDEIASTMASSSSANFTDMTSGPAVNKRLGRRIGGEQAAVELDRHRRRGVAELGVRRSHELAAAPASSLLALPFERGGEVAAAGHAELVVDAAEVVVDRAHRQVEPFGDQPAGLTRRSQQRDLRSRSVSGTTVVVREQRRRPRPLAS